MNSVLPSGHLAVMESSDTSVAGHALFELLHTRNNEHRGHCVLELLFFWVVVNITGHKANLVGLWISKQEELHAKEINKGIFSYSS